MCTDTQFTSCTLTAHLPAPLQETKDILRIRQFEADGARASAKASKDQLEKVRRGLYTWCGIFKRQEWLMQDLML